MQQYQDKIKYVIVGILMLFSFLIIYVSLRSAYFPEITSAETDRLSGKEYAPVASEDNPYAPYFVGFDELINRGVSNEEVRYINDVLTNFTLYNEKTYRGKVSYVKDSFERDYAKTLSTTYRFKFGINDSNIHIMNVTSNASDGTISIKIMDGNNKNLLTKDFIMTQSDVSD